MCGRRLENHLNVSTNASGTLQSVYRKPKIEEGQECNGCRERHMLRFVENLKTNGGKGSDRQWSLKNVSLCFQKFLSQRVVFLRWIDPHFCHFIVVTYFPTAFHTSALVCGAAEACTLI